MAIRLLFLLHVFHNRYMHINSFMSSKHKNNPSLNPMPTSSSSNQKSKHTSFHLLDEESLPAIKRRRRFTAEETKVLEKEYEIDSSPNQQKIQAIANSISTPRKIVTTWFQNRRAKHKRKKKLARGEYQEDCDFDLEYESETCTTNNSNQQKEASPEEDLITNLKEEDSQIFDGRISNYGPENMHHGAHALLAPSTHCHSFLSHVATNISSSSLNYRPIIPITTHPNQILENHRGIDSYLSGNEPCFFSYRQQFSDESPLIHNSSTRVLEYQQDGVVSHHDFNSFLASTSLEATNNSKVSSSTDAALYINPADIYLKQPSDTEINK